MSAAVRLLRSDLATCMKERVIAPDLSSACFDAPGRSSIYMAVQCMQYSAVNGWIRGNSNGKFQTTYNGTANDVGNAITKQPTLFGTDLQ